MESVGLFFLYALTAIFLENTIFTRTLGIGRLVFLGTPKKILVHCVALTGITFFSSMLSYAVQYALYERKITLVQRGLLFLVCVTVVYLLVYVLIKKLLGERYRWLRRSLPVAAFNSAVLGSLVLATTSRHSFAATVGFGLGTGIGYTLALLLVYSGRRRLDLIPLPRAFKGMPIMLLYIGLVSLAIYGLIGHQLPT